MRHDAPRPRMTAGCPISCPTQHTYQSTGDTMTTTQPDIFAAIDRAYAEALARHEAGTCHLSEWSCSYCEQEAER